MAASLIRIMLLASCTALAQAEPLPDPTRPAIDLTPSGAVSADAKPVVSSEGLRTILISPDRRSAIINGQQIPLGGKFGEERLMAVCEDRVVLQGSDGRREVSLYPEVSITGLAKRNCLTPAGGQAAAPTPKNKLNKIRHAPQGSAASKKEKSCK
jgi:MSHA biogenesis protein MshK